MVFVPIPLLPIIIWGEIIQKKENLSRWIDVIVKGSYIDRLMAGMTGKAEVIGRRASSIKTLLL